MDSLRSLSSPTAHAIRDGEPVVIPTAEVVPGDLMELKAGDTIPADIRLVYLVAVAPTPPFHLKSTSTIYVLVPLCFRCLITSHHCPPL